MSTKETKREVKCIEYTTLAGGCPCECHDGCSKQREDACLKCIPFVEPTLSQCCNTELYETKHEGKILHYFCSKCGQPFFLQQADTAHMSQKRLPVIKGMQNGVFNTPLPSKDWMDKEREAFYKQSSEEYKNIAPYSMQKIADYWLSRIQSQIEAERVKAKQEVGQGATRSELVRIRIAEREQGKVEERERIVKMIEEMKGWKSCINHSDYEPPCIRCNEFTIINVTLDKLLANLTSNE